MLWGRWRQPEIGEQIELGGFDARYAGDRFALQAYAMPLDAAQSLERVIGRQRRAGRLQTLAHHPLQDQRHEADRRLRAAAVVEQLTPEIDIDHVAQAGLVHGVEEARLGTLVRQRPAVELGARILRVQLTAPLRGRLL